MPAKHNEKTREALKRTQDFYSEKISSFKEECHSRLEERLKLYDQRVSEAAAAHSPKKKAAPEVK